MYFLSIALAITTLLLGVQSIMDGGRYYRDHGRPSNCRKNFKTGDIAPSGCSCNTKLCRGSSVCLLGSRGEGSDKCYYSSAAAEKVLKAAAAKKAALKKQKEQEGVLREKERKEERTRVYDKPTRHELPDCRLMDPAPGLYDLMPRDVVTACKCNGTDCYRNYGGCVIGSGDNDPDRCYDSETIITEEATKARKLRVLYDIKTKTVKCRTNTNVGNVTTHPCVCNTIDCGSYLGLACLIVTEDSVYDYCYSEGFITTLAEQQAEIWNNLFVGSKSKEEKQKWREEERAKIPKGELPHCRLMDPTPGKSELVPGDAVTECLCGINEKCPGKDSYCIIKEDYTGDWCSFDYVKVLNP